MPTATLIASAAQPAPEQGCSLADVLDRILHCGVSLEGNLTIGVADVDLLFLDLRLLLAAIDTVWPDGLPYGPPVPIAGRRPPAAAATAAVRHRPAALAMPAAAASQRRAVAAFAPREVPRPTTGPANGLVRLVLTLVNLLHDVLERLAVQRMNGGQLSAAQIERVGAGLLAQAEEIERLRREFGLTERDLALNLGLSDRAL